MQSSLKLSAASRRMPRVSMHSAFLFRIALRKLTMSTTETLTFEARTPIAREDLKDGENLCEYCTAKCCRYYAFPIDTPKKWKDFDYMRWYLLHGKASFFVDEGTWFIMVLADCKHLQADNGCGTYETRPQICREYTTKDCEYDNDSGYDQLFECPEQIEEYAEAILPPKKRSPWVRERAAGLSLPVVSG
jgi:Fe-S-cluster containining protein